MHIISITIQNKPSLRGRDMTQYTLGENLFFVH